MKKLGLALLTLCLTVVLAACGGSEEASNSNESEEAATRTVEHAMGTAEVPTEPKRVVVLTNEGTEALIALGVKQVGAVKSWNGDPWYPHIESEMTDVTEVGTESEVNLEAIAKLEPDLIIGTKLRQENIYDKLNAIAPTVMSETLKGDWQENFALYANALNLEDKGKDVLADYDQHVEDTKTELGDAVNKELSVVRFLPGASRIYFTDSFSGVILGDVGVKRPASQDRTEFAEEVTMERIPEMDGDHIVYFTYGGADGSKTAEEWQSNQLWKDLKAVKAGEVTEVSDDTWNTSGGVLSANEVLDELVTILK
ncbi:MULTISPECIES: ABC transporter substrate-binding protein [unclassified Exiguobacterium]|uniref:ABC transporter substrate-binding protein n=1 Tax=unclassified Exiguobacterium TaxID=2644629 RepID=UPI001039CB05|nr:MULTISPECIES: iron-siderophore ABC transporter substrate-binding protein [unclassified Exiguobacterium]TCI34122.1 iron-siderophore ABC transporter substrate-binding protein [Exiguobacterium sp. SH4S7]TCI43103.1 iron-siderophore ABC transporter substrate-binding protein [Exiguobacterium sp. SH5S32]TCI49888.1 iron-siderophore ABC transporter substrate-binding protein [Exiguobacterium sp. SH1S4]TCI68124.1 iron-siderophore ABC transporter substrate-binding protein [Exiguobacterium sp. SH1S1]